MERVLIVNTPKMINSRIKIAGWVHIRRDHGKLIFLDVRDRSGIMQTVFIPSAAEAYQMAKKLREECVVEMEGLVKARPIGAINQEISTGGIELEVEKLKIISQPKGELPVDISQEDLNLRLKTLLDYRQLTLRNKKISAIFLVYAQILSAYAEFLKKEGFVEIKTPKILNSATEGGANFFKIKYFEREAYLAQSPQFYKQAGVGVFERVFEIGSVFRAEPHFTTRHVNEFTGLDAEMGFIDGMEDVMRELEKTIGYIMRSITRNCKKELEIYKTKIKRVGIIPRLKLTEALEILDKHYGKKMETVDIDAEGERMIGEWAKKIYKSDFIFLTHYPFNLRPFYSMPSSDPQYTETFDLLYKGVEIASGGQRIHEYDKLALNIKKHNLNPVDFKNYLDIFKYGMPMHGGWGLGSERILQQILGLKSIKEAILFPRDVKRLEP